MKIQAPFLTQAVPFGLVLALLAGCSDSNEFSDLRGFFDEVAAEPVRPVQPVRPMPVPQSVLMAFPDSKLSLTGVNNIDSCHLAI